MKRKQARIGVAVVVAAVLALGLGLAARVPATTAAEASLNLYSGRHYPADKLLYARFEAETGIRVRVLEGKTSALLEKLRLEGADSPADIFLTADAGNLWRAQELGLFQAIDSPTLRERIPQAYRSSEDLWFGFAARARLAFYDPEHIASPPERWSDLANAEYRGELCVRSSANIYNLSLTATLIEELGEEEAARWVTGFVANFARPPAGGDTDQLRAAAAGECGIAVANSYYFARLVASDAARDQAVVRRLKPVWLTTPKGGVHFNISGGGVLASAKNKAAAVRFLEFLASEQAQETFAAANNEYPLAPDVRAAPALEALNGPAVPRDAARSVEIYGRRQAQAQRLSDRVGWN